MLALVVGTAQAQNVEDQLRVCDGSQQQFKTWFPRAYQKDYQGQRNVSLCLADGCDGGSSEQATRLRLEARHPRQREPEGGLNGYGLLR